MPIKIMPKVSNNEETVKVMLRLHTPLNAQFQIVFFLLLELYDSKYV